MLKFPEAQQNILMIAYHCHQLYVERQNHRVPRRFSILDMGLQWSVGFSPFRHYANNFFSGMLRSGQTAGVYEVSGF